MVSIRALPRTYCTGGVFRPGMPTSANVLPCSSLNSSGLYMTGKLAPVVVLMIRALVSSLLTGLTATLLPKFNGGMLPSTLKFGAQLAHQVLNQALAQRLQIHR